MWAIIQELFWAFVLYQCVMTFGWVGLVLFTGLFIVVFFAIALTAGAMASALEKKK